MENLENNWILYLKHWAEVQPDKTIFKEAGREGISYLQFYTQVSRTAAVLLRYFDGQMPEKPIAVAVSRNIPSLAAMLGVCAAGGWYVPVDSELPPERTELLLSVCAPAAILMPSGTDSFPQSSFPKLFAGNAEESMSDSFPLREETLPMFGIFTSGSTGIPKLVVKDRRGIHQFIEAYCRTFELTSNEIFGNQIPFYFDASTKDIFSTIYLGATTVLFPQQAFSFPVNLVRTLNEEKVSTIVWVPSALSVAARFNVFSTAVPETLRNVLFVGERMPVRYLNCWRSALPETRFVNLYGSTEVAGNSCYYIIDREFDNEDILPIGHAFDTATLFFLDESGLPSTEGEICVAGNGLALGYYGDKEKTAAAFSEVSFTEPPFQGRIYHSGDYGKLNEYGEYICIARKDAQIKHMGHRIELGDIEVCVSAFDYVGECCCLFAQEAEKILLFCSCSEEYKKQLRKDLSEKLPKYMLPHDYICMPELPHNRNGKTDRAGLLKSWQEAKKSEKKENL